MHPFADDKNLLRFNSSTKKPNKLVNLGMKDLCLAKCQQNFSKCGN